MRNNRENGKRMFNQYLNAVIGCVKFPPRNKLKFYAGISIFTCW